MNHIDYQVIATLLILLAALGAATWNAFVKSALNRVQFACLMVVPQFIIAFPIALLHIPAQSSIWVYLIFSSLAQTVYILYLANAYNRLPMNLIYPLSLGLAPILNFIFLLLMGVASPSYFGLMGFFIISFALIGLALFEILLSKRFHLKLFLDAFIIASFIVIYATIDYHGIRRFDSVTYISWLFTLKALIFFVPMVLLNRLPLSALKHNVLNYVIAGLLAGGGYAVAVWAFSVTHSAIVLGLRATAIVFSILIAKFVLNEFIPPRRVLFILFMFLGVFLILIR